MFPILSECVKHNGFIEHTDLNYKYVLWVLPGGQQVSFIHKDVLATELFNHGMTFGELLLSMPTLEEPCKIISRMFLQTLGYKPDYVVVTDSSDEVNSPHPLPTLPWHNSSVLYCFTLLITRLNISRGGGRAGVYAS